MKHGPAIGISTRQNPKFNREARKGFVNHSPGVATVRVDVFHVHGRQSEVTVYSIVDT